MFERDTPSVPVPLVSICISVWNDRELAARAVESALHQTYPSIEVVVVDDASSDGSAEYLRERFGSQIQLWRNARNAGQARTLNAAVTRSTGVFVKFLHHDDYLREDCVERMVQATAGLDNVGLMFSRRSLEFDEGADEGPQWRAEFSAVHSGFPDLRRLNSGTSLLETLFGARLRRNSVGEPSCVMVRRTVFDAAGGMNPKLRHFVDLDLWLRILARGDAVYIDEELATYRRSRNSVTGRNTAARRGWMDRLWIVEALLDDAELGRWRALLLEMRAEDRKMAWRTAARGAVRLKRNGGAPGEWLDYELTRAVRCLRIAAPTIALPRSSERVT